MTDRDRRPHVSFTERYSARSRLVCQERWAQYEPIKGCALDKVEVGVQLGLNVRSDRVDHVLIGFYILIRLVIRYI
jgi:hypothetical protein